MEPTTNLNDGNLNCCICRYVKLQQHQVLHETIRELSKQGELSKDILQRVILPAQFEDATPSECTIIYIWIDGLKNAVAYVTFNRHSEPRLKLEHSLVYPGMTAGVCWTALSSSPITAHFPSPINLNKRMNNPEVYLSEQSVKEHNLSLLLTIDSHHQH